MRTNDVIAEVIGYDKNNRTLFSGKTLINRTLRKCVQFIKKMSSKPENFIEYETIRVADLKVLTEEGSVPLDHVRFFFTEEWEGKTKKCFMEAKVRNNPCVLSEMEFIIFEIDTRSLSIKSEGKHDR